MNRDKILVKISESIAKMNRRQAMIYTVIVGFMFVTVGRVANYAGSFESDNWRWLGWFYAVSVDVGIIICARFTEWKTTWLALPSFILLVLASGALSIAQVEPWHVGWGAWVYAILPTAAQALLGFLARDAGQFRKSRSQSDAERQLRVKLKETNATIERLQAELAQKRVLVKSKRADFDRICAELDGSGTPTNINVALAEAGFKPISESTIRSRLQ